MRVEVWSVPQLTDSFCLNCPEAKTVTEGHKLPGYRKTRIGVLRCT